ncbi:MAG: APC family permease [Conexivisphaerales archaeon]
MTEQKGSLFVRESTGLVKRVSLLDAIALNISNMSAGAALATIGFTMYLFPQFGIPVSGMNLVYGSLIAFLLSIPQIIVYTMMSTRYPKTGGDYVWVSRTFGGLFGSSLSFMGYTLETLAYLALIALSAVFAIGSVGVLLGNSGLLGLAIPGQFGGDAAQQFIVGAAIFAALIGINIFKPKAGYKLVSALMIIGVIIAVLAIGVILLAGKQGVINYAASVAAASHDSTLSYNSIVSSNAASSFSLSSTLLLLPFFAIFVYPWLNAGPAVAGEIRGRSSIRWNVPLASLIVMVLVTSAFGVMYLVAGIPFTNGALSNTSYVIDNFFNFWTLAMGVTSNAAMQLIIGLGWVAWNLAILAYGIIVFSRYMFSQAFDRFLPSRLAYVSPRFGSPVVAHIVDLVITIALIGAASFFYGTLTSLYGAVVASMIYFAFVGLAAAVHGIRKEKGGQRNILLIAGLLQAAVFLYLISDFLAYPGIWGGNVLAYGYVAVSFVAGLLIYLVSRSYHKRKGINIDLAYKEIPPD